MTPYDKDDDKDGKVGNIGENEDVVGDERNNWDDDKYGNDKVDEHEEEADDDKVDEHEEVGRGKKVRDMRLPRDLSHTHAVTKSISTLDEHI